MGSTALAIGGDAADGSPRIAGARSLATAHDVALMLAVPASWVYAEARAGRLPAIRLGRYVRFDLAEVEAWLASQARSLAVPA